MAKQTSKQNYELLFIINPTLSEEDKESLLARVRGYLEQAGSDIVTFKNWGLRRLAYAIKGQKEGQYYLVNFSMLPERVADFRRNLILAEGVLREMIVRIEGEFPPERPERSPRLEAIPVFDEDINEDILDEDDEED
ncbi:MAG TPA: 30S ribosomal protein S6 [Anaerolineae bacterium]|nr:30S ribosomal protein S6 [Anaerolineae bacterium]HQK14366.1 30S ribosomal protein S6 [Anaerolineae bacterium]